MAITAKVRRFSRAVIAGLSLVLLCACNKAPQNTGSDTKPQGAMANSGEVAEKTAAEQRDLLWQPHLLSVPSGWQPAAAAIKIRFRHPVASNNQLQQALSDVVTMQPNIDAKVIFSANDEISIVPNKPLRSGERLELSLSPQKLQGVADTLAPYTFSVQALIQDYELHIAGLKPMPNSKQMRLHGSIKTADAADPALIEQSLTLEHLAKPLKIQWQHQVKPGLSQFQAEGIARGREASTIELQYAAQKIGVEKFGRQSITVPAVDEFRITGAQTAQSRRQYIEVNFSKALDSKQNLNGLVQIDKQAVSSRIDGSTLRVYPAKKITGPAMLSIDKTLRSANNQSLSEAYTKELVFISELPGVRFSRSGSIIPPQESISVPIEAVNVNSLWVSAFEVYENNIPTYLQNYSLSANTADTSTGRYLWRKKITLPSVPLDTWQRFDIDLQALMQKHAKSIVNLEISIDKSNLAISCKDDSPSLKQKKLQNYEGPNMQTQLQRPQWFKRYYSPDNGYVTYEQRRDPCHAGFYSHYSAKNVKQQRNFFMSDIGLIVKKGERLDTHVVATSIAQGKALGGVELRLFNFQHQLVASATSNKNGMATLQAKSPGFYLVAQYNDDKNYLRLPRNEALPTSQFDTRGEHLTQGLKGFIYGERDVWRPGDDIYLSFILEDTLQSLPAKHPVSLDFFDPRGNKLTTLTRSEAQGNIYTFKLATKEDSPTGNWRAVVRVGGEYFDKIIKVETITPNRLKVDLTPAQRPLQKSAQGIATELFAQWLHGATAKNLKAKTELKLRPTKTAFEGYSQYLFDDPASSFKQYQQAVFDGSLDNRGKARFTLDFSALQNAPGKLKATFVSRVFERSGNFSTSIRSEELLPYSQWVGLHIAQGSGYRGAIARNQDHPINIIAIDSQGKPLSGRKLQLQVYKIGWRWWWEQSNEDLSNYVRSSGNYAVEQASLVTDAQGKAKWQLAKNNYDWGRHLIRVCDTQGGHCSGKELYLGWSWRNQVNPDSATQLMLATDKQRYQPGDTARITIPELAEGKILYSLENGSEVLEQKWLDLEPGAKFFELAITEAMAPNVYLNTILILPQQGKQSDSPIRLYGIAPLIVDDPNKRLQPQLSLPQSVRPQSEFEVTVSEANQKQMHYTLAMVDEGLLGITGYRTPNPLDTFNKREALGVLTWDMYDGVLGAYGASLERLLKIGGGDQGQDRQKGKDRRFPPVVKFLGAFTLQAGGSKTHRINLPQYMGAVRLMLVASSNGAYGKAESSVQVKQPLNLLATLPRVLGPGERVSLPVNVFVSDASIKQVEVKVSASDIFKVTKAQQRFTFEQPGDQIASLELEVLDKIGPGEVRVIATAGNETAEQTIVIESRAPNPASTISQTKTLQPGEAWTANLSPHGMPNTNQSAVTISSFPPINLEKRLGYLIRYPHGCIEQSTSAVFPQLFLQQLKQLDSEQQHTIETHVLAAIDKFRNFQKSDGGFSYWPGTAYINAWASIYATHFLVEAKALGYAVPNTLLDRALNFLKAPPQGRNRNRHSHFATNAYRLMVLARAESAEVAQMNRMRESLMQQSSNSAHLQVARWQLAIAYQHLGLNDIATQLLEAGANQPYAYDVGELTYGSQLRDTAILLSAYNALDLDRQSWQTVKVIAAGLSSDNWYSTQSLAWAFIALSQYASKTVSAQGNRFAISEDAQNTWQNLQSIKTFYQQTLAPSLLRQQSWTLRNDGDKPLHIEVSNRGTPPPGQEQARSQGLSLSATFYDNQGEQLDVGSLPQGQDFYAEITVRGLNNKPTWQLEDLALLLRVPSGWQIRNQRLEGDSLAKGLDYQDIRDDSVLSYFSLWKNHRWYYRYNDNNRDSQTIRIQLNASFAGKFYLPAWQVQAMYQGDISAQLAGQWVEVMPQASN
ncbi:MAG: hypothetical protein KTR17_06880 [Cellvibrionaceae bacterium]|nr:hypothetical protein [Cellvibrionaceae bacterium]